MKTLLISTLSLICIVTAGCEKHKEFSLIEIENPAGKYSFYPHLFTDNSGVVWMSWMESKEKEVVLKYVSYSENQWSDTKTIASGSTWLVNWADFPSVIGQDGNAVAAHWLQKIPGNTYSYNINMAGFIEAWPEPLTPHIDGTATEHGFVSMEPASDSTFLAVWLDGRNTEGREHHEYSDIEKAMTLRAAFISYKGDILEEFELDDTVCDCCNTSLTATHNGFIAAYRDRTENEIRDIYTISYRNGEWGQPEILYRDDWNIAACPVNGPAIDAFDDKVAAAWFSAKNGLPIVKMAISNDNGESFAPPVIVDDINPSGRVDLNFSDEGIWLSWIGEDSDSGESVLKIHLFNMDGEVLTTYTIPKISKSRRSGFPQITPVENGILIAYTDISGEEPKILTHLLN